jgi:3-hydroxybutyryl-CoA dehydrogenase
MRIAVWGGDSAYTELVNTSSAVDWEKISLEENLLVSKADAFFLLDKDVLPALGHVTSKPVFISAVTSTVEDLKFANAIRFNGWPGFISLPSWEVAGDLGPAGREILKALGKEPLLCADEPGLISPRIIAMVINEAYFALDEGVSTQAEIDIAMKLGTNYPYGPFEWADRIGINNVYMLLEKLSMEDKRYKPAPGLKKNALHP